MTKKGSNTPPPNATKPKPPPNPPRVRPDCGGTRLYPGEGVV